MGGRVENYDKRVHSFKDNPEDLRNGMEKPLSLCCCLGARQKQSAEFPRIVFLSFGSSKTQRASALLDSNVYEQIYDP